MSADMNAGVAPLSNCGPIVGSPPANANAASKIELSDSELSELEEEEDIGEVTPHHEETGVPVFIPSMDQFKNFKLYMNKINKYGMKTGIVKVIPPKEWSDSLPPLTEAIKTIRVKEPIAQDIMGTGGTYRQANIVHQRSYNLPQWRQLCDQSDHQPPAKRGERRAHQDRAVRPSPRTKNASTTSTKRKSSGRSLKKSSTVDASTDAEESREATSERLLTPVSPSSKLEEDLDSVKNEPDDEEEILSRMRGGRQPKVATSISSRRKHNRREAAGKIDEEAFKDFEYRLLGEDFHPERCEELERAYWKTLTYASPLYGADMPGSLFDDRTTCWNLGKLENILDVLGTKIPGVNTAYLYLGMWKATFAWHLEDVDLYSINFLHFGAPKQWYSISQGDARKFEQVMRGIWPADAKACSQFLRHKTFLISPTTLYQSYGIKANKIVHHPGQFVITFPYGYHSGYNLGYNCAEAVNFALDSWIDYGKIAKRCECDQAQDSVWIDVREIERKLKGEESEVEDSEDEGAEEHTPPTDLPTPPESSGDSTTKAPRKRKRPMSNKQRGGELSIKKPRIHMKMKPLIRQPCMLCTTEMPHLALIPAILNNAEKAKVHRECAIHVPETYIEPDEHGDDVAFGAGSIHKARLELKCAYCKSKKGGKIQCTSKTCVRSYHVTCARSAGCVLERVKTARIDSDGTEYIVDATLLLCRYHRTQREKKMDGDALEGDTDTIRKARDIKLGETCQFQYHLGNTFAGRVVENNIEEEMFLVDLLPLGDRIEIAHKWIRLICDSDYKLLPKPSAKAIPMPVSQKAKDTIVFTQRRPNDIPIKGDVFLPGFVHEEFVRITESEFNKLSQLKVDLGKGDQIWYYLGESSTEAKAQFTEDPSKRINNPKGHFLSTIPKPLPASSSSRSYPASYPGPKQNPGIKQNVQNPAKPPSRPPLPTTSSRPEKPYEYKPRSSNGNSYSVDPLSYRSQQNFLQQSVAPQSSSSDPRWRSVESRAIGSYGMFQSSPTQAHQSQTSVMGPPSLTRTTQNTQPLPKPNNGFGNGAVSNQAAASRRTSSSPKYSSLPESLVKKYPYLAKQFNRDASTYRSPYRQSPPHGFMNGYEGDLKGYLQQNPDKLGAFSNILNQYSSSIINPLLSRGINEHAFSSSGHQSTKVLPLKGPSNVQSTQTPLSTCQGSNTSQSSGSWGKKDTSQLHPAIRQDYGTLHHQSGAGSEATKLPHSMDNPAARQGHPHPHPRQQHTNQASSGPPSQEYNNSQLTQHQMLSPSETQTTQSQLGRPQSEQALSPPFHTRQQLGQNQDEPFYSHQGYIQKSTSSQPQAKPTSQEGLDVSDVPIDSASVVENIVGNLRRHARLLDSSTSNAT